ncbi:MAG: integrin alpha, partial [Planctomycetota bacterium]|nr:integrin alpha [Planctomycetota bacterium]
PFLGNGGGAEVWATLPGVGFSSARTFQHSGVGNGAGISVSILPGALGTIYLAAGAPLSSTGSAIVWNVATQAELHEIIGSNSNTHFGFSVGLLDDVNFDGEPDLAIGEPGASHVEVIDLQSPTLDSLLTIDGTSGDRMGWSLAPVGDSNGTLTGDLVVAASRMNAGAGSRQGGIAHWSPPDTNLDPPTISVNSSYMQGETVDITVSNLREACDVYFYAGTNQNPTTSAEGFDLDIGGFLFGTTGDYFHLASSVTGGTANHQITIPPTVAPGTPLIFQVATERAGFVRVSDIDGGVVVAHPFELVLDTPPTAGQTLQMHCDYGHPNSVIYWFYGTALGNSGALGGTISNTGLNSPQSIGTTTANSSGTSNQTFDVPPPAQGHTVYFSVVSWALNDELLDVSDPQVVL